jgi:AAA15 family ATPase/GTPase
MVHAENSVPIRIYVRHKIKNSIKGYSVPLEEATGTLKMFVLYSSLSEVFAKGGILVVDDLNSRLHLLLVEAIISVFHDKKINQNNGQLIFTSHDASAFKRELMRRDEINFVEKELFGESQLYSIAGYRNDDRKIRKEENFERNYLEGKYLEGKYGAIPELSHLKKVF